MSIENTDGNEKKPKNKYLELRKTKKEIRFDYVFERHIVGMRYMEIVRAYVAEFKESERTAKKYIQRVEEHLANPAPEIRAKKLNKSLATYNLILSNLIAQGKWKEAADVRAKMDRLEGLDRIIIDQNVNVNQDYDYSALPPEMLDELLRIQAALTGNVIQADSIDTDQATDVDYEEVDKNPDDGE